MERMQKDALELKVMRIKAGVKAIDVAIFLGWSPSKLSLIENDRTSLNSELLTKIEQAIITLKQKK